jgi:ribonuclease HI
MSSDLTALMQQQQSSDNFNNNTTVNSITSQAQSVRTTTEHRTPPKSSRRTPSREEATSPTTSSDDSEDNESQIEFASEVQPVTLQDFSEPAQTRRSRSQTQHYVPHCSNTRTRPSQVEETNSPVASVTEDVAPEPEDQAVPNQQGEPLHTWTIFTDGSFIRAEVAKNSKAGWGVVVIQDGGLEGPQENHGTVIVELGGKVAVRKGQNFLQNAGGKRSNNTAELSAIGEAILYALQELRSETPPRISKIVIRSDSTYAENNIKGVYRADENKYMIYEIKRSFKDLTNLATEKILIWNGVMSPHM